MKNLKNKILIGSGTLVLLATSSGVLNAMYGSSSEGALRLGLVSLILGLGSIGTFFVGVAYPKDADQ